MIKLLRMLVVLVGCSVAVAMDWQWRVGRATNYGGAGGKLQGPGIKFQYFPRRVSPSWAHLACLSWGCRAQLHAYLLLHTYTHNGCTTPSFERWCAEACANSMQTRGLFMPEAAATSTLIPV
jgi:hypothetical protein